MTSILVNSNQLSRKLSPHKAPTSLFRITTLNNSPGFKSNTARILLLSEPVRVAGVLVSSRSDVMKIE